MSDLKKLYNLYGGLRKYEKQYCVYFLLRNETIVYIGKSFHLESRLNRHRQYSYFFDSVYILNITDNVKSRRLEKYLINLFKPKNKTQDSKEAE